MSELPEILGSVSFLSLCWEYFEHTDNGCSCDIYVLICTCCKCTVINMNISMCTHILKFCLNNTRKFKQWLLLFFFNTIREKHFVKMLCIVVKCAGFLGQSWKQQFVSKCPWKNSLCPWKLFLLLTLGSLVQFTGDF